MNRIKSAALVAAVSVLYLILIPYIVLFHWN